MLSVKPQVAPNINWDHPSAKGLIFDEPLFLGQGPGSTELVQKIKGTFGNAASVNPSWSQHLKGRDVLWNPGAGSGAYQWIDYGSPPNLTLNRNFSIMALVNFDILTFDGTDAIISHGDSSWYFRVTGPTTAFSFLESQQFGVLDASTPIVANTWNTGAVTVDSGATANVAIYTNGKPDGTGTTTVTFNTGSMSLRIGGDQNIGVGAQESFSGHIAYVRVWNRVLAAAEIKTLTVNPWQIYKQNVWNRLNSVAAAAGIIGAPQMAMMGVGM